MSDVSLSHRSPADLLARSAASPAGRASRRSSSRPQRARAYCGEAHRHGWTVFGDRPPEVVDLPVPEGTQRYRLVRHPRTGRPARDVQGALIFIPLRGSGTTW
jgi:hypothetical protein